MNRKYLPVWPGLLFGVMAALTNVPGASVLFSPWNALGGFLRGLSDSGAGGNAAAWALCIALSLLPAVIILLSRQRRKAVLLSLPVCASAFGCLYLLINPTLIAPAALPEEMRFILSAAPVIAFLSVLLTACLILWSEGAARRRPAFWLKMLLGCGMAIAAFSAGLSLISSVRALLSAPPADLPLVLSGISGPSPAAQWLSFAARLVSLIPHAFLVRLLGGAVLLTESLDRDFFSPETDRLSSELAVLARRLLIASAASLAAGNLLELAAAMLTGSFSVSLALPLSGMILAAAALLLSSMLSSALRLRQENDLMI